jgi:chorismate-pyruvate lyase
MEEMKNSETLEKIMKGLKLSFRRLLEEKKRNNQKLVIMRGDEIVWVTAEELEKESEMEKEI